jgi:hypothetical protein
MLTHYFLGRVSDPAGNVGSCPVGWPGWRTLPIMRAALGAFCMCMSGCVEVTSYKQGDNFDASPGAIPYILPKTNFVMTAIYTLNCVSDGTQWKAQIAPSITVSATSVRDDNEKYYIKSEDLKSLLKDSQISIGSNPNQALASVNGTVNDLVGPTIATAFGVGVSAAGAGSLAKISPHLLTSMALNGFLPDFAKQPAPPPPKLNCGAALNENTSNALHELISLRKAIDN